MKEGMTAEGGGGDGEFRRGTNFDVNPLVCSGTAATCGTLPSSDSDEDDDSDSEDDSS